MADGAARTRLREAALDLFGRQGVRETSTRAILNAAGMRNPSAISYHFGSKAGLVDDLVAELISESWPVVLEQVELASSGRPSVEEWAAVAADSAARLVSTERGCLLARIWWEYDSFLHPDAFEQFLGSGHPVAVQWQAAIGVTFPELPHVVAVARNLLVVRTLESLIARRAARILTGKPAPQVKDPDTVRRGLLQVSLALLTMPAPPNDEDLSLD